MATYEAAQKHYKANYSMVARLGKAVPADDDVRSLLVQLNAAADKPSVDFRTINISAQGAPAAGPDAAPTTGPAPPPGASTVGTAGFSTMPFSFNFKGSFFQLGKFFNKPRQLRRGPQRRARRHRPAAAAQQHHAHARRREGLPEPHGRRDRERYLLPPTEGLTAGATAAGPTGAAAAGGAATPSPSTPATTTTAAISGVNR